MSAPKVPVIDLFSGPGGLSEGFAQYGTKDLNAVLEPVLTDEDGTLSSFGTRFKIGLSVEMDGVAHQTLRLRAFFRHMSESKLPLDDYFRMMRGDLTEAQLYENHPRAFEVANNEAWNQTLGVVPEKELDERIKKALNGANPWVLLGGPPCQAYSLVGRSRNKGKPAYNAVNDQRHFLYKQYLRIVAVHQPTIFVMENVKGLLSSSVAGERMFETILADLRAPGRSLGSKAESLEYDVIPFTVPVSEVQPEPADFVLRMEHYGIPQARHRVILLGIKRGSGLRAADLNPLPKRHTVRASLVLTLPRVRSSVTKADGETWLTAVSAAIDSVWFKDLAKMDPEVRALIRETVTDLTEPRIGNGAAFLHGNFESEYARDWYSDERLGGAANHVARGHMTADLHRYLYAACFAKVHKRSPDLSEFPWRLYPKHENARDAVEAGAMFSDRFRVQLSGRPSTTVTSHISKDGHYYIHHDPAQCRSLTVREAARLQTFPDNYFFCGNRTQQYHQVGNAVPPLLAIQLASAVSGLLARLPKAGRVGEAVVSRAG